VSPYMHFHNYMTPPRQRNSRDLISRWWLGGCSDEGFAFVNCSVLISVPSHCGSACWLLNILILQKGSQIWLFGVQDEIKNPHSLRSKMDPQVPAARRKKKPYPEPISRTLSMACVRKIYNRWCFMQIYWVLTVQASLERFYN